MNRHHVSVAFVVLIVSASTVGRSQRADAHAILERTAPAVDSTVDRGPDQAIIFFNEPVEVSFGGIRVFDTRANRVDTGETHHVAGHADEIEVPLRPELADGTYTVAWKAVSADGHPVSGAYVFHVGAPGLHPEGIASRILNADDDATRLPTVIFSIVRWLNFLALLALAGGAIFAGGIWLRSSVEMRSGEIGSIFERRLSRVLVGAWCVLAATTLAGFALQGSIAGDMSMTRALAPTILGEVAQTRYGIVALVKLGLLLIAAVLWKFGIQPLLQDVRHPSVGAAATPAETKATLVIGGILAGALLATPGLAGHPGTTPPVALNVVADVLHMLAAATWIGGLTILVTSVFPAVRADPDGARAVAPVVTGFSNLATIAVAVIVVTGVYRAWEEVGAWRALTDSTYGWVLLAKIGVFLPLLGLGAISNRWTKRRIERAVREEGSAVPAVGLMRRLVTTEVALAVVVLGLTAVLVNLPPARVEAGVSGPFIKDISIGAYNVNVVVQPNVVGRNEVHLTATTKSGTPAPIKEMTVLFRMPEQDIGPLDGQGRKLAQGHFVVQGRQLSVPGTWQLQILARTSLFDEETATVSVTVND